MKTLSYPPYVSTGFVGEESILASFISLSTISSPSQSPSGAPRRVSLPLHALAISFMLRDGPTLLVRRRRSEHEELVLGAPGQDMKGWQTDAVGGGPRLKFRV